MLETTRQPNLSVIGSGDTFIDLDPRLLDEVMRIDGVRGAAEFAYVAVAPEGFANYFGLALIDQRGETIRPIHIEGKSAADLKTAAADEVFLNESMRDTLGKQSGDTVRLATLTPAQFEASLSQDTALVPAGPSTDARIVGVSRSPEDVSDAPDPFLLLPPAFYAKYGDSVGNCRCDVVITADPAKIEAVAARLGEIYPGASVERGDNLGARIADTVSLQKRAWWVIALSAAVAGAVALLQASARLGHVMSGDDPARAALGMTRAQRRLGRFLVMALAMVIGSAGAIGIAYVLSPLAPVGITLLAEPSPGFRWESSVLIPGVVIVLAVSLLTAGAAAVLARRKIRRARAGLKFGGPQVSLGNRLAFGPGRGAILGILLATAGSVGGITLEHSINHVLVTPALYGADFDAANLLDSGSDKRAIGEQLAPDPEIDAVGLVWVQLPSAPMVHVVGPHGEADISPNALERIKGAMSIKVTQGRPPGRADEVAIGRSLMKQLGATVGDQVTAVGSKATLKLVIVGDNLDPGVDIAGQGFGMTVDGLGALVDPSIAGTVVRFTPGADKQALLQRYSELGLAPVSPPSEILHIGQLGGLPGRVGQLFTLLGIAALINAIVLTVRSGRREVAIHRALGFTSRQVLDAHLWEGAVVAVSGVLIGGVIGIVVGRAIDRQLIVNVGGIAHIVVPSLVWVVAFAIVTTAMFASAIAGTLALRNAPGRELHAE
ncbi:MAG: putative transport system permease protein [Ilumatobacteraceae bacterium]